MTKCLVEATQEKKNMYGFKGFQFILGGDRHVASDSSCWQNKESENKARVGVGCVIQSLSPGSCVCYLGTIVRGHHNFLEQQNMVKHMILSILRTIFHT